LELPETVSIPEMLNIPETVVSIPEMDEDILEVVVNTKVIDTDKASVDKPVVR